MYPSMGTVGPAVEKAARRIPSDTFGRIAVGRTIAGELLAGKRRAPLYLHGTVFLIARGKGMDKAYPLIIVNRIRPLCKNRRISINGLAERGGVSQSTLDNLAGGKTFSPKIKTLHKMAPAFGISAAEFLDYPALNEYFWKHP